MYQKLYKFKFVINIENADDQNTDWGHQIKESSDTENQGELLLKLDNFISQRPYIASSTEYNIIRQQLVAILHTKKVNLNFVVNNSNSNGKLLIIIRRLNIESFIIPNQQNISINFHLCKINNIDYSKSKIAYVRKHCIPVVQSNFTTSIVNKMVFFSHIYLRKLFINTSGLTIFGIINKQEQNFLDLQQFVNLQSIIIEHLNNDILLPENLKQLDLEQYAYDKFKILNKTINTKCTKLLNFNLLDVEIVAINIFHNWRCKFRNYIVKRDIDFTFHESEIVTLTVSNNVKKLQLPNCKIDTLELSDYDLEDLKIGFIDRITVGVNTIFNSQSSPYALDLSKLVNLKAISLFKVKIASIKFPNQVQSLDLDYFNQLYIEQEQNLDLSHLQQLQNLRIVGYNLNIVKIQAGRFYFAFVDPKHRSFNKILIQVNNQKNGQFDFNDYLERIEKIEFEGVNQLKIQGQPYNIIDGHLFKGLQDFKSEKSPNIKVINYTNKKSIQ